MNQARRAILFEDSSSSNGADNYNPTYLRILSENFPDHDIILWSSITPSNLEHHCLNSGYISPPSFANIEYAVVWKIPSYVFQKMPNLKAILMQGAGIDGLGPLDAVPLHVPIVRLIDDNVMRDMVAYALHWALHFHFSFNTYLQKQADRKWQLAEKRRSFNEHTVGVLGAGQIGLAVCSAMLRVGFRVVACSRRSGKIMDGVTFFSTDDGKLEEFLSECDTLVNTLPNTTETENLLNHKRFSCLRRDAVLINIGRGKTVDEDALLSALDCGHMRAAVLDVFRKEPLPPESALWEHRKVVVTPHVSGEGYAESSASSVVKSICKLVHGKKPKHIVDRELGY